MRLELTRRYALAASHRLHSPQLDEAENQRIYGKCNNPFGHGHNYVVEVTISGPVDPATGMIANLADLDGYVAKEIVEPFDHTYLNKDVEAFRKCGIALLATTTPEFEGRSFGTNVLEAAFLALLGKRWEEVKPEDYGNLLRSLKLKPRVERLETSLRMVL